MRQHRVIHVLRAPVGGLFRHVRDLVAEQSAMGLELGVVCDSRACDALTDERLAALQPHLQLGLHKVAMSRDVGLHDLTAYRAVRRISLGSETTVLHGHGAKGGAYARLAAAGLRRGGHAVAGIYTPHGGSLHYHPATLKGRIYMALEQRLASMTSGIVFESAYSAAAYERQVGPARCPVRVIPNGLLPHEFTEHRPVETAADVVFIGELRHLKGVDVLLDAIAMLGKQQPVSAVIVGDGPDAAAFRQQAERLGLSASVEFPGAMPASRAFPLGRVLIVPSRAESFPYIVLEAAAAGVPLIASSVGGIPEIVAGTRSRLVEPGDAVALATAIREAIEAPDASAATAASLRAAVEQRFTVERMAHDIVEFYAAATNC